MGGGGWRGHQLAFLCDFPKQGKDAKIGDFSSNYVVATIASVHPDCQNFYPDDQDGGKLLQAIEWKPLSGAILTLETIQTYRRIQ